MPHIKSFAKYYDEKNIIIYAIHFPFNNKIYVGKTVKHAVKSHYKDHYILRNKRTSNDFEKAKELGITPKMYLLEDLQTTEAEAYKHCVAWIKYFLQKQFVSISFKTTNEYAGDLNEDTEAIYKLFCDISLDEILCEERILIGEYKTRNTLIPKDIPPEEHENEIILRFAITKKEAQEVQKEAEKRGWTVSEYCRAAAVDGCHVNVDYNFLWRYLKELMGTKSLLQQVMFTIYKTGRYFPQDLENVQKMIEVLEKHKQEINNDLNEHIKKIKKEIKAARKTLK